MISWYGSVLEPFPSMSPKIHTIAQYIYRFLVQRGRPRVDFTLVFITLTTVAQYQPRQCRFAQPQNIVRAPHIGPWHSSWNNIRLNDKHTAQPHPPHPPHLFDQWCKYPEPTWMRKYLPLNPRNSSHNVTISARHTLFCLVFGIVGLAHLGWTFHNFLWVHPQLNIFHCDSPSPLSDLYITHHLEGFFRYQKIFVCGCILSLIYFTATHWQAL